ncbi:MAG: hypothetical protein L6V93_00950 [Clostridiales bacterium]|nr:MAG: hypothetical protein L6V93_00950 [Clostridiales bacterium]
MQAYSQTAHCRYHLLAIMPASQISQWFAFPIVGMDLALFRFFFAEKNQSYAPSFLLFRKKGTLGFACSLVNALSDGSLLLPPLCECVFGANIFMAGIATPETKLCIACSDFSIQKCAVSLTTFCVLFTFECVFLSKCKT